MRLKVSMQPLVLALAVVALAFTSAPAQTTSGSISGAVTDGQGGSINGATVQAISTARNEVRTTQTNRDGRFVFVQMQPDAYMLHVEAKGFKVYEVANVVLNANGQISVADIVLTVGQVTESVSVIASGEQLQTESGERGSAIVGDQLKNIAVNGRSYLALTKLSPGVVNTNSYSTAGHAGISGISVNGARNNQNNLTLDGIGNVDTGNNGDQLATVSLDVVEEFKILTSNYQAEYGRSSGAQISVVTKRGSNEFHGSGYIYHRNESLNANSWLNNRNGQSRNLFRFNNFGYTIGGPVYLPRFGEGGPSMWSGKQKLYFFFGQEYQKQLRPQVARRVTVPTAAERNGDFSSSVNSSGTKVFIRDYTKTGVCNATTQTACFSDGGVINKIPANRLYGPGLAILRLYPLPNTPFNSGANYTSAISDSYPRREDIGRIDYKHSDTLTFFGRYVNNDDALTSFYGAFVLGANLPLAPIRDVRPGSALALGATKIFNSTTVNEITAGFGKNQINIDATNNSVTRAATGLSTLPSIFPGAIQKDYLPQFNFNGGAIANGPNIGTNNAPFFNSNRTVDVVDNFSKILGQHSIKAGAYYQHSWKNQTVFTNANGNISFINSASNPFDTQFGYSNAATGVFNTYNQASQYPTGKYRYTNLEFYVQDNVKIHQRLTLDYGVRFYYMQPQYDKALQTSTFLPQNFDRSKAVRLYQPAIGIDPVTGLPGKRVGFDALTGVTVTGSDIGKLVPGSGSVLNGIAQAGTTVSKYLQKSQGILFAPRFGFAFDLTGKQNYVLRGGGGVFYDRYQGNETFDMLGNPPTTFTPTLTSGLLQNINPKDLLLAPSALNAFSVEGQIPTVYQYNLGVQAKLPHEFKLDVAYVGSLSRHLLQRVNLNAIPYGALYKRENQDATLFPGFVVPATEAGLAAPYVTAGLSFSGSNALPVDLLRPYRGYGNINIHQMGGNSNYNSLQASVERRFARSLFFQAGYTWSRAMGNSNVDADFLRIDSFNNAANYGPLSSNRKHNLVINSIYQVPGLSQFAGSNKFVKLVGDDWQLSGIYQFQSGAPYQIAFSIPGIGNAQLTGSSTEGARVRVLGAAGSGNSGDPYRQLNAAAFTAPLPGSIGLESGRNYLVGPGVNNVDLSVQKSIGFGEKKRLELRMDAFNFLNHTQWSAVNATLNVTSLTNFTPTNLPFDSTGKLVNPSGFGTVSVSRDPRIIQLVARFIF